MRAILRLYDRRCGNGLRKVDGLFGEHRDVLRAQDGHAKYEAASSSHSRDYFSTETTVYEN